MQYAILVLVPTSARNCTYALCSIAEMQSVIEGVDRFQAPEFEEYFNDHLPGKLHVFSDYEAAKAVCCILMKKHPLWYIRLVPIENKVIFKITYKLKNCIESEKKTDSAASALAFLQSIDLNTIETLRIDPTFDLYGIVS